MRDKRTWRFEQRGEHKHSGVRALHAAAFEVEQIVAANEARNEQQLTSTTRESIAGAGLDSRSAFGNVDFARKKIRTSGWFNTVLPTSDFFDGTFVV